VSCASVIRPRRATPATRNPRATVGKEMGALILVAYLAASVALVWLPSEAKIVIGAIAFAGIYWLIRRRGKIAAGGLRGGVLRVLVTIVYWTVLFFPSYVFFRFKGG
jgi:hypothetical protein